MITPDWPYPPQQGTALRNWHLLKGAAQDHEVFLLSLAKATPPSEALEAVRAITVGATWLPSPRRRFRDRLGTLAGTTRPDLARRLWSPGLVRLATKVIASAKIQLVQAEGLEVAGMALAATSHEKTHIPVLFDDHNAEWRLQGAGALLDLPKPKSWGRMLYSLVQSHRLRRYESALIRAAALTIAVSPEDAQSLSSLAGRPVRIVPNGIDMDEWQQVDQGQIEPNTLLFTGKLDYRPNVDALCWFCGDVLPRLRSQNPATRLLIAGRSPGPAVLKLTGPGVKVIPDVPEIRSYFSRASVYVIPMRMGSGSRFKLLEAWAAGVPVVATAVGAAGTAGHDGKHLLLANDPTALAQQIGRLVTNPGLARELVKAGRSLVTECYDWSVIWPKMAQCYDEISAMQ